MWRIGYCASPEPAKERILAALGFGSTLGNGRWHTQSPNQLVYAGSSRALCQLEKRVHCNGANPANQALMRLDLPDSATILDATAMGLPANWKSSEAITQDFGMQWLLKGESLGMWVPSFMEPNDKNMLINPAHHLYSKIQLTIERKPFEFDPRLFAQ